MSLTQSDLQEIRSIVRSEVDASVTAHIQPLRNEILALREDIKEIYAMISKSKVDFLVDDEFEKLTLEKKILLINAKLINAAKQAGVKLPR